jgi:two-component system sensor histidine kinase CpxA
MAISMARRGSPVALDRIELEAGRMNDLINQLLEVARAEVDPATLDLELVDLRSLLTEIADYCGFEASQRDCHVDLTFFQPGSVLADSEILRRAIENVLRNAIHHSPAGGRIELSAVGDDESALVSICDEGIGVPDQALEEIFQPFFRVATVTNRNSNGAGLGLAIAHRAISIHRGTIRAENGATGLRVEIKLPRKRACLAS